MSVVLPNNTSLVQWKDRFFLRVVEGRLQWGRVWNQTLNFFSSKLLKLNLELFTYKKIFKHFQTKKNVFRVALRGVLDVKKSKFERHWATNLSQRF